MQARLRSSKPSLAVNSQFVFIAKDVQNVHPTSSQCNKHQCDNRQKTTMHDLPDDILISVFSSCDIDTLFTLRLTCTSFSAVIQAYIKTIAPLSARFTFPNCDLLLIPPEHGYTLRWLRNLIPAQLASIVLDKDKLRRHPYINSGFPYGIPSESDCAQAKHWRSRIANGWRVLRFFHLISAEVYISGDDELKRPNVLRKVSGGVRASRIWQTVSCPYSGCTEHSVKHLFNSKIRCESHSSHNAEQSARKDFITEVRRKETLVLRRRLDYMRALSDYDLLDYTYLWRILLHIFRPYCKPDTTVWDITQGLSSSASIPCPSWPTMIRDIAQGCSWLNWFILHIGTAPFQQQWSLDPSKSNSNAQNHVRNDIWKAWNGRTTHQIEIEREYISKFEFALRRRCLSSERLKRLETEIARGRNINTISLDCIPWSYDLHHSIPRPPTDFPWYKPDARVWLNGEWALDCAPGANWSQPGALKGSLVKCRSKSQDSGIDGIETVDQENDQGPLGQLTYLVYLGIDEAGKVWPGSEGDGAELAF